MFARVLILSLCLSLFAPGATIDEVPPSTAAEPEPVVVNISYLIGLALTYTYPDLDDPEVEANVIRVITPIYEAFLAYLLTGAAPPTPAANMMLTDSGMIAMDEPLPAAPLMAGLDVPAPSPRVVELPSEVTLLPAAAATSDAEFTAVPEPSTWWLAGAGALWMARRWRRQV